MNDRRPDTLRNWLALPLLATLAACTAVGPEYQAPESPIPDDWSPYPATGLSATPQELIEWWTVFEDPELAQLVQLAHEQNYTLELAGLKVLEARAQRGIATGLQYPQQQLAAGGRT